MKKAIAILIAFAFLALTACGDGQAEAPLPEPDDDEYAVVLTIPAVFFEEGETPFKFGSEGLSPGDDLEDYVKDNDFLEAAWNEDDSLTIAMSLARYDSFKADMVANTTRALSDIVESGDFPFVKSFEAAAEFKTVTMLVDRAGYKLGGASAAFLPILVGTTVGMYRGFVGDDEFYTVVIADFATGERIEWIDFPLG